MLGKTISHYRILEKIGEGGMGEVYRAEDTSLKREVAIKVLPERFTQDPQRLARFKREAQLLASLNHPNIAAIYGLDEADGVRFLVLELVEGETLAERVAKGPLPVEEALEVCRQIAEGVEAAHEKGVIHRDLKPANVKITPEGQVKVLDFGLAKALEDEIPAADISHLPTLPEEITRSGMILGTAAYMSPQQAQGKQVDKRTDIWAFGCVLYKTLTGKRPFEGETVTKTLAAILKDEPDWEALPENTPWRVQDLLRRCLQKDPRARLRDIGDARIEIQGVLNKPSLDSELALTTVPASSHWRQMLPWAVLGVMTVLAASLAVPYFGEAPVETQAIRFLVSPPEKVRFNLNDPPFVSPDGKLLVFTASTPDEKDLLWVRPLDSLTARPLPGTEGAYLPFWSPDSRYIAFFADAKLKKIEISGGPAQTLCDAPRGAGGTWNRDGVIVFAPDFAAPLHRVSAAGGEPKPVTVLDPLHQETSHMWPYFLPDSRHFVYQAWSSQRENRAIHVGSLDGKETKRLLMADLNAVYAAPGYLLFVREGTLMAQPFDVKELQFNGEPFAIVERVALLAIVGQIRGGAFSVSENGVLVYRSASSGNGQLVWCDREGKQLGVVDNPGDYSNPSLSPDETRLAVAVRDPRTKTRDLWLFDLTRATASRFTFEPSDETNPVWSSDGTRVVFTSDRKGYRDIYQKRVGWTGEDEILLESNDHKNVEDWSLDGRFILYNSPNAETRADLWVLPLFGDQKPIPFLRTQFSEDHAQISPDGGWVAYTSNESGRNEIYVQSFPEPGGKWQISTDGGSQPKWRRDGKELFYTNAQKLMAVEVKTDSSTFKTSIPKALFDVHLVEPGLRNRYLVTADGQRFLINLPVEKAPSSAITVVVNWTAGPSAAR